MTFILPAELFGTRYRGTFYGLAAASGKLGAITILLIINYGVYEKQPVLMSGSKLAGTLLGFVPAMLLGAFITWAWIPEVQFPRGHHDVVVRDENMSDDGLDGDQHEMSFREKLKLPNRPLANIAQDPEGGHIIGIRRNLRRLFDRSSRNNTAGIVESGAAGASRRQSPLRSPYIKSPQSFDGRASGLDSGDLRVRGASEINAVATPFMGSPGSRIQSWPERTTTIRSEE